jgi:hypothetical protein
VNGKKKHSVTANLNAPPKFIWKNHKLNLHDKQVRSMSMIRNKKMFISAFLSLGLLTKGSKKYFSQVVRQYKTI